MSRIQKAIPLAQITVAACMCSSSMMMEVPRPLKIAEAMAMRFSPTVLEHKHVMDFPTDIAVFGILLMIGKAAPINASIRLILKPVMVEISTCFSVKRGFISSKIPSI